ncbi:sigma-70 family RNA polymerase sigma factor [Streptomyces albus]|uniref:sigma-70 family RNA polymerase sigma factor n=1 Tax=Streptomyces albus TaxID=1888 RepID=UPI0014706AC2|nr:sigma-70 family RNA polymerase sigma factor [Streptomyces albus]
MTVVPALAGPVEDFVRTAVPPHPLPSDPVAAFDELYLWQARALTRQAFLLSGHRRVAERAVRWAFHQAWQHWPKVVAEGDPTRTVRAGVYEYALSPWHQFHPGHRAPDAYPGPPKDRAVLEAFLALPRSYRAALLLHYGLGLTLPETAAEVECSTQAAAGRVRNGRAALEESWPALRETPLVRRGAVVTRTLRELAVAQPVRPVPPRMVRQGSLRTTRRWTRASVGLTATVTAATAFTLVTTDTGRPLESPAQVPRTFAPATYPGQPNATTTRTSEAGRGEDHRSRHGGTAGHAYLPQLRSSNERVDLDDFLSSSPRNAHSTPIGSGPATTDGSAGYGGPATDGSPATGSGSATGPAPAAHNGTAAHTGSGSVNSGSGTTAARNATTGPGTGSGAGTATGRSPDSSGTGTDNGRGTAPAQGPSAGSTAPTGEPPATPRGSAAGRGPTAGRPGTAAPRVPAAGDGRATEAGRAAGTRPAAGRTQWPGGGTPGPGGSHGPGRGGGPNS